MLCIIYHIFTTHSLSCKDVDQDEVDEYFNASSMLEIIPMSLKNS